MQLPHPPEEGWILGSAPTMLRKDHHRALSAWARQLGPVYAIRIAFWHVSPLSGHLSARSCQSAGLTRLPSRRPAPAVVAQTEERTAALCCWCAECSTGHVCKWPVGVVQVSPAQHIIIMSTDS